MIAVRCVVLLLALFLATPAWAADLVLAQPIALKPSLRRWVSPDVAIDPQTATIRVRLRRPTTLAPLAWDATGTVRVSIVVTLNGVEYRSTGQATGGIRSSRGVEMPFYELAYTPPWGFFGARSGFPTRLGERRQTSFTARVEIERLAGTITTDLDLVSTEAPAPLVAFRSSVAFDTASSAEEVGGSSPMTWTHTASGTDPAVFVGASTYEEGVTMTHAATYAGAAMTAELWDFEGSAGSSNNTLANMGSYQINPATGAQTVSVTYDIVNPTYAVGGAISMTGVHQTTPVGTAATGSGLASPATVTSGDAASGDLVVDNMMAFTTSAGSVAADAGQTVHANSQQDWVPGNIAWWRQSYQAGADGGVMSWTITNILATYGWVSGAVAFKPAAGAPGGGGTTPLRSLLGVGQ